MRILLRAAALVSALALGPGAALAAPMGFKGSVMAMGDFGPNWREAWVNYAITPRDAVGVGGLWHALRRRDADAHAGEVNYTRLLSRWNLPDAQANVWLLAGVGGNRATTSRVPKRWHRAGRPGRLRDHARLRRRHGAPVPRRRAEPRLRCLRAGFSFYEVDYDQMQPWLVVEARRMRGLSDKTEITPMLRLIHNRYFVELGRQHRSARPARTSCTSSEGNFP